MAVVSAALSATGAATQDGANGAATSALTPPTLSAPPLRDRDDGGDTPPASFSVKAPRVVQLGWGWSQERAAPIPTVCIEFEPVEGLAQTSNISIEEVQDNYTLSRAMNVSSSVSVRAMGTAVDGKAELAKTAKLSSMSVSYLVSAEVLNAANFVGPKAAGPARRPVAEPAGGETAAPGGTQTSGPGRADPEPADNVVRLADWAVALARRDVEDFRQVCGEGYVAATIGGARAYLLSVVETKTKSQRETMRASVTGSGWGQKVAAAAGTDSESASASFKRNLTFFQEGGSATTDGAASELPENATEAIARIKALASAAASAGKTFEIEIAPYEILQNFPKAGTLPTTSDETDGLTALWGAYTTIYDDLASVLQQPENFIVPRMSCSETGCAVEFVALSSDRDDLMTMVETMQDLALDSLARIERTAEACISDGASCSPDAVGPGVRSPYAVLANMPLPRPEGEAATTRQEHTSIFMRDAAASRCHLGASTPGCISNREIRYWAARTGLLSRPVRDRNGVWRAIAQCDGIPYKAMIFGDADDEDAAVLWHSPNLKFDPAGNFDCEASSS